jgi:methyl-accepting chemotaxis protein
MAGLVFAVLFAAAAAYLLEHHVQRRTSGIARVTEDVSAIAKGELDRRIVLQSSDDARGLADNVYALRSLAKKSRGSSNRSSDCLPC